MPQCSFGTERKPGSEDWIWLINKAIINFVTLRFARVGFLASLIPDDQILGADDLCASEPEVLPLPAVEVWAGAINRIPQDIVTVYEYVKSLYLSEIWPDYCRCTPGSAVDPLTCTPFLSHPRTYDSTSGSINDYGFGLEFIPDADCVIYGGWLKVAAVGSGTWSHGVVGSDPPYLNHLETVVPTTTDAPYYFATPQALTAGKTYKYFYQFVGTGGAITYQNSNSTPGTSPWASFIKAVYKNPLTYPWDTWSPFTPATDPIFCPGPDSPEPYTPIEPEDPVGIPDYPADECDSIEDLCRKVTQLLAIARFTDRSVAWLQNSLSPDSWVPGTTTSSLTGSGTITAPGILGLFVTATVPASWGYTYETPPRLIPAIGSIQWSVDGVPVDSTLIHYDEQHVFGAPAATDEVIYNFQPGVVGQITLLTPFK